MLLVADIGGSNIRIAASEGETIENPIVRATPQSFEEALHHFIGAAGEASQGRPVEALIVGIAGVLSDDHTTLMHSPHLPDWEGRNLSHAFSIALGVPVHLENDALLGGLGEAVEGAGKGASIVAYVAVGTGIGGARIVDGRIDRHALGFEVGHQYLGATGEAREWEELCSGSAIEKLQGKPSNTVTDRAVWDAAADVFAYGLYNLILHWSPNRVVLGGALFNNKALSLDRVSAKLREINRALPTLPEVVPATLGDYPGLHGARIAAPQMNTQS